MRQRRCKRCSGTAELGADGRCVDFLICTQRKRHRWLDSTIADWQLTKWEFEQRQAAEQ